MTITIAHTESSPDGAFGKVKDPRSQGRGFESGSDDPLPGSDGPILGSDGPILESDGSLTGAHAPVPPP